MLIYVGPFIMTLVQYMSHQFIVSAVEIYNSMTAAPCNKSQAGCATLSSTHVHITWHEATKSPVLQFFL